MLWSLTWPSTKSFASFLAAGRDINANLAKIKTTEGAYAENASCLKKDQPLVHIVDILM